VRPLRSLRARARAALAAVFFAGGAMGVAACVDLFHSTQFDTLCSLDASAPECREADAARVDASEAAIPDAAPPAPTDFCKWTPAEARLHAQHACAWLGACAGTIGKNQLGPCMIDALLAYDCTIDPARPVRGEAHAYWDDLWKATTCDGARGAVLRDGGLRQCGPFSSDYLQCASSQGGTDTSTRVACMGATETRAPRAIESCAAGGQSCTLADPAACAGPSGVCTAKTTACTGGRLTDCDRDGAVDLGVDCTSFGDQRCAPDAAACLPLQQDAAPCGVDATLRCGPTGIATSCPAGRSESVDCHALLGDAGGCNPDGGDGRAWDVTRGCTAGACTVEDYCDGATVRSCARGVTFAVDCTSVGLGPCLREKTPKEAMLKARCAAPQDSGL
jgi:hypothetical protein